MKSQSYPFEPITFIVPVGNEAVYNSCFLASPLFTQKPDSGLEFQILPQRGFKGRPPQHSTMAWTRQSMTSSYACIRT